jgi:hypothetical protein
MVKKSSHAPVRLNDLGVRKQGPVGRRYPTP